MTRHILILATVVLTTVNVFAQCSVNITGATNPIWCLPCNGQAMAVSTGTPPFSYSWSTGDSTNSIDSLCAGTHIITMTDSLGCVAIDSVDLTQPSAMTVSITTTPASCPTCNDGCITITPSDGCGAPYTINTIPLDPFFMPCQVVPGTYIIEICDACSCCIQDTTIVDSVPVSLIKNDNLKEPHLAIYPNPFSGVTAIEFSLPTTENAYITVFDISGEQIAVLFDGLAESGKVYNVEFDARNIPGGIYYYRLINETKAYTKKLVVLK